jgi:hypothetical protein
MKRALLLGIVLGIVVVAIMGGALVLDLVNGEQARDILTKVMSVIGIAVAAMILIMFVARNGSQN